MPLGFFLGYSYIVNLCCVSTSVDRVKSFQHNLLIGLSSPDPSSTLHMLEMANLIINR